MKVILLEDDWEQVKDIKEELEEAFPGMKIQPFKTIKGFESWLESIDQENPPDVFFILDMMVRYQDPEPGMTLEDGLGTDFFTAGFECFKRISRLDLAERVIIHTVATEDDLKGAGIWELIAKNYVRKDQNLRRLVTKIQSLIRQTRGN